jgi:hypothetical protein
MATSTTQTASKLTPAQRAMLFEQATRQHRLKGATMAFAENASLSQVLPKSRFLSKIYLMVEGTYKLTHASKTTFAPAVFDKFNLIRNIRLNINNGFSPFNISGAMLYGYNLQHRADYITDDLNVLNYMSNTVSSGGATNTVRYMVELPITVNQRDALGLINLQHGTTQVELNIDCNPVSKIMTDTDVTVSNVSINITPILETYSVPSFEEAIPDYTVVKIVNEQRETATANGETVIKLPVGLTYRKLLVYIASDSVFTPISSDNVTNFALSFNQADTPYDMPAKFVQALNTTEYGKALPAGYYAFDFSDNGIPNYGGGRDYIDTEKLTEFWLKVNLANTSGNTYIYVISEKLAQM